MAFYIYVKCQILNNVIKKNTFSDFVEISGRTPGFEGKVNFFFTVGKLSPNKK